MLIQHIHRLSLVQIAYLLRLQLSDAPPSCNSSSTATSAGYAPLHQAPLRRRPNPSLPYVTVDHSQKALLTNKGPDYSSRSLNRAASSRENTTENCMVARPGPKVVV